MEQDNTEIIQGIINELSINYRDDRSVLERIYKRMAFIASDVSHRQLNDAKLIPYVEEATISAYLRRGKEGTNGYTEGSESESYIDIEEKLRKDMASIRRLA